LRRPWATATIWIVSRTHDKQQRKEISVKKIGGCREGKRTTAWELLRSVRRHVKFGKESPRGSFISNVIPAISRLSFGNCFGVNIDWAPGHYRLEILRRASDHGTGFTVPESSPLSRRFISACQATSASSSTSWSRLSRRDPARAALASGGSLRASFSRSFRSCFIGASYTSNVVNCNLTDGRSPRERLNHRPKTFRLISDGAYISYLSEPGAASYGAGGEYGKNRQLVVISDAIRAALFRRNKFWQDGVWLRYYPELSSGGGGPKGNLFRLQFQVDLFTCFAGLRNWQDQQARLVANLDRIFVAVTKEMNTFESGLN
jgi:hypothetical protein